MQRQPDPNGRAAWTTERLQDWLKTLRSGGPIIVLANREPFQHDRTPDGGIVVRHSAGGLVTAIEPLVQACRGVWVAHGAGTADRLAVDCRDGLNVPPANPRYRLRRVWLDADEERGYYYGFANEGLWPLCHRAHVRPVFRSSDFHTYRAINARFAGVVCEEAESESPLILVQDYHVALAPRFIRDRLPRSTIVAFWHIPWPNPRDFAVCPWGPALLNGLLGSSIVGFQTPTDCANFMNTVERFVDAHIDRDQSVITHEGHQTIVRAYPVSVDWPSPWASQAPPIEVCRQDIRRRLRLEPDVRLGVGVDRLDYTKGINEKCLAIERLLELYPEFRGRFVFAQLAAPSRACLSAYRELRARLLGTIDRVNGRFGNKGYRPIVLFEGHHEPPEVFRFLRAADLCYVGSLHDGMNLVAKEFVSAREDDRGVLVLSGFTGAARELTRALIVNPHDIADSAHVLADALRMTEEEQSHRMREMRSVVAEFSAHRWAGQILHDAARLHRPQDVTAMRKPRDIDQAVRA